MDKDERSLLKAKQHLIEDNKDGRKEAKEHDKLVREINSASKEVKKKK